MTSFASAANARTLNADWTSSLTLPVCIAAIFVSAFLLFGLQPMFTKMVLPVLGGSPAVWSVAMVFFQALLLAGYLYAHILTRLLSAQVAGVLHLGVMACAFLVMPISVATGWGKPPVSGEAFWLLGLFAASVGLPFFAVAGNGPLLQAWFARSDHAQAKDPYFLYAASNIGSFAALISYPLAMEPFLSLREQSQWWMIGFLCLAVLVTGCAFLAGRRLGEVTDAAAKPAVDGTSPGRRDRLAWIGLSFVPSGLLVAVTAHISTDVAAMPLLWVAPLALFLLTFVLAFREQRFLAGPGVRHLQIGGTALVLLSIVVFPGLLVALALHLGMFFLNALICHAALYQKRPSPDRLTEFYLCMSLGGVLGGIFCGLLAPYVFSTVVEYPILLVAALFGSMMGKGEWRPWAKHGERVFLACAVIVLVAFALAKTLMPAGLVTILLAVFSLGALTAAWRAPKQIAPLAIAALLAVGILNGDASEENFRSFFGVHKVKRSGDGEFLLLAHGTTLHGAMRLKNADGSPATGRPELTSYYVNEGAIASGISLIREAQGGVLPSVAAVGLGTGSLACHIASGEAWTFFEIDPEVRQIATDPRYFRFLRDCGGRIPIVLGDARLKLAEQSGGNALILIDAFSSDAIPAHLLTREAMGLYLAKLSHSGAMLFHISNRHVDLRQVIARTAAEHGLVTFTRIDSFSGHIGPSRAPSIVAIVTRSPAHVGRMETDGMWKRMEPDLSRRPWTDDFSNILQAIVDKKYL
jgi:hypothetical protein